MSFHKIYYLCTKILQYIFISTLSQYNNTMDKPLITIITVCYNSVSMIEKTLKSVSEQDYINKEYIIVDGGSTDGTLSVLQKYNSMITKMVSEKDNGIYDAMNKGVALAMGKWCMFMNSGDMFVSNDIISRVFNTPKDSDVIYGDIIKANGNGIIFIKKAEPPHNGHRMYFCHQAAFTKTECLRNTPYDIKHKFSADFKLYKMLWKQKCIFQQLDFPIAVFDTSGVSNTCRSKGLADNISVICEVDGVVDKIRLLPRLLFTYCMAKMRGK